MPKFLWDVVKYLFGLTSFVVECNIWMLIYLKNLMIKNMPTALVDLYMYIFADNKSCVTLGIVSTAMIFYFVSRLKGWTHYTVYSSVSQTLAIA